ncbi:type II toxin-antitoxin system TacA family antitoxin [Photorhabdus laumondii]
MRTQPKETPINIRAKSFQRELIDHAANLHSKTRTDFILDTA